MTLLLQSGCGSAVDSQFGDGNSNQNLSNETTNDSDGGALPLYYGQALVNPLAVDEQSLLQITPAELPSQVGVNKLFFGSYLNLTNLLYSTTISTADAFFDVLNNELFATICFATSSSGNDYNTVTLNQTNYNPATVSNVINNNLNINYIGTVPANKTCKIARWSVPSASNYTFTVGLTGNAAGNTPPVTYIENVAVDTTNASQFYNQAPRPNSAYTNGTYQALGEQIIVTGKGLGSAQVTDAVLGATVITPTAQSATSLTLNYASGCTGTSSVLIIRNAARATLDSITIPCKNILAGASRKPIGSVAGDWLWFAFYDGADMTNCCPKNSSIKNFKGKPYVVTGSELGTDTPSYVSWDYKDIPASDAPPNTVWLVAFNDPAHTGVINSTTKYACRSFTQGNANVVSYHGFATADYDTFGGGTLYNCTNGVTVTQEAASFGSKVFLAH